MKILYISSEVVPFAKTGGLADVAGALPDALARLGHEVAVVLPRYGGIDVRKIKARSVGRFAIDLGGRSQDIQILECKLGGSKVRYFLVDHLAFFGNRKELYQEKGVDFPDNLERFVTFSKACIGLIQNDIFVPDVLHANDWQSALTIPYLKEWERVHPRAGNIATIYSIHNMGYMGLFSIDQFHLLGLPGEYQSHHALEFYGKIALTKAGFVYADRIGTVSPTYAKEIQTSEMGLGLEGLLQHRQEHLFGILNGVDYALWDPAHDPALPAPYTSSLLANKKLSKKAILKDYGLPGSKDVPLFGLVTRLADQKGFDILADILPAFLEGGSQWVVLGTGEPKYHALLDDLRQKHPKVLGVALKFDAMLAQRIYAGCDYFLMPSRYEPCGLGQLISFRYGTIPVVRATGGLADTVFDLAENPDAGTGFVFSGYTSQALGESMAHAVEFYKKTAARQKVQKRIMNLDYSWKASAKQYIENYELARSKQFQPV